MKKMMFAKGIKWAVIALAVFTLVIFLTMNLWNVLIPQLFKGPILDFWQTAGLLVLSKIFFGGFRKGGGGWGRGRMMQHWKQRMQNMTPEEREKFQNWMQHKCGKFEADTPPHQS